MQRGPVRFTKAIASLIACALAAWQPSAAIAQEVSDNEVDTQLWVYATAQGQLSENVLLTVDGSARWREKARGDEQQTLRFTIEKNVGGGFIIGGGGGVFETQGGSTELRPHQQFTWRSSRISTRTRIEQRFFDGADRMEFRFRQSLRYTLPLSPSWKASIDGEYLNLLQTRNRNSNAARDQWRGRLILTHDLTDEVSLAAGYLYIYTPQPDRSDQVNHVPQIILTRQF